MKVITLITLICLCLYFLQVANANAIKMTYHTLYPQPNNGTLAFTAFGEPLIDATRNDITIHFEIPSVEQLPRIQKIDILYFEFSSASKPLPTIHLSATEQTIYDQLTAGGSFIMRRTIKKDSSSYYRSFNEYTMQIQGVIIFDETDEKINGDFTQQFDTNIIFRTHKDSETTGVYWVRIPTLKWVERYEDNNTMINPWMYSPNYPFTPATIRSPDPWTSQDLGHAFSDAMLDTYWSDEYHHKLIMANPTPIGSGWGGIFPGPSLSSWRVKQAAFTALIPVNFVSHSKVYGPNNEQHFFTTYQNDLIGLELALYSTAAFAGPGYSGLIQDGKTSCFVNSNKFNAIQYGPRLFIDFEGTFNNLLTTNMKYLNITCNSVIIAVTQATNYTAIAQTTGYVSPFSQESQLVVDFIGPKQNETDTEYSILLTKTLEFDPHQAHDEAPEDPFDLNPQGRVTALNMGCYSDILPKLPQVYVNQTTNNIDPQGYDNILCQFGIGIKEARKWPDTIRFALDFDNIELLSLIGDDEEEQVVATITAVPHQKEPGEGFEILPVPARMSEVKGGLITDVVMRKVNIIHDVVYNSSSTVTDDNNNDELNSSPFESKIVPGVVQKKHPKFANSQWFVEIPAANNWLHPTSISRSSYPALVFFTVRVLGRFRPYTYPNLPRPEHYGTLVPNYSTFSVHFQSGWVGAQNISYPATQSDIERFRWVVSRALIHVDNLYPRVDNYALVNYPNIQQPQQHIIQKQQNVILPSSTSTLNSNEFDEQDQTITFNSPINRFSVIPSTEQQQPKQGDEEKQHITIQQSSTPADHEIDIILVRSGNSVFDYNIQTNQTAGLRIVILNPKRLHINHFSVGLPSWEWNMMPVKPNTAWNITDGFWYRTACADALPNNPEGLPTNVIVSQQHETNRDCLFNTFSRFPETGNLTFTFSRAVSRKYIEIDIYGIQFEQHNNGYYSFNPELNLNGLPAPPSNFIKTGIAPLGLLLQVKTEDKRSFSSFWDTLSVPLTSAAAIDMPNSLRHGQRYKDNLVYTSRGLSIPTQYQAKDYVPPTNSEQNEETLTSYYSDNISIQQQNENSYKVINFVFLENGDLSVIPTSSTSRDDRKNYDTDDSVVMNLLPMFIFLGIAAVICILWWVAFLFCCSKSQKEKKEVAPPVCDNERVITTTTTTTHVAVMQTHTSTGPNADGGVPHQQHQSIAMTEYPAVQQQQPPPAYYQPQVAPYHNDTVPYYPAQHPPQQQQPIPAPQQPQPQYNPYAYPAHQQQQPPMYGSAPPNKDLDAPPAYSEV